jgi:nitroreductase
MNRILKNDDLIASLKQRYATKAFDPTKKISEADWKTLEQSLVLTPSSFGLQPWKFVVVQSPAVRAQLLQHAWGQKQVTDASHFVVFTAMREVTPEHVQKFMDRISQVRNSPADATYPYRQMLLGFLDMIKGQHQHWATRQVYIALGQLMASATLLGVDACPMEGISPAEFDKLLGLEGTNYTTIVACALGTRTADDKYAAYPKVRFETADVVQYV